MMKKVLIQVAIEAVKIIVPLVIKAVADKYLNDDNGSQPQAA